MVNRALIYIAITFLFFGCGKNYWSPEKEDPLIENDSLVIAIEALNSVIIGINNVVWIGTNSGLLGYNGVNWKLIYKSNEFPIASDSITDLAYDSLGVWICSDKGINYLKMTFEEVLSIDVLLNNESVSEVVSRVFCAENNEYWFGTQQGLILYTGSYWSNVMHFYSTQNFNAFPITSIAAINDTCYAGTNGGGVVRYINGVDGITGASALWPGNGCGLISSDINCLYVDKSDFLWIGSPLGVQKHTDSNPKITGNNWFHFTSDDGLIDNEVNAIVQDQSGCMWFGTNKGISKYDGTNWTSFTSYNGLASDTILDLTVDSKNQIWAISRSTLSCFNNKKWMSINVPDTLKISLLTNK
jgi:ligand-binding sensor domain-containing protein